MSGMGIEQEEAAAATTERRVPRSQPVEVTPQPSDQPEQTAGVRLNAKVLRNIQKALEQDPEADIATVMPLSYSAMLLSRKEDPRPVRSVKRESTKVDGSLSNGMISAKQPNRSMMIPDMSSELLDKEAEITFPISEKVRTLARAPSVDQPLQDQPRRSVDLCNIIAQSTLLWQSSANPMRFVARCSPDLVIKCVSVRKDLTEYTSLQYLKHNPPELYIPQGHGLVVCREYAFVFMSYMPGATLDSVWNNLGNGARAQIRSELDDFFNRLRQLQKPNDAPLGGVANEGCKDTRRHTRVSKPPIYNMPDFCDFLYGKPSYGSKIYLDFLASFGHNLQTEGPCVFTHADVHPGNISVQHNQQSDICTLTGIVDWEMSGFYPDWFECIKATNLLATNEDSDWFLNLPSSISPSPTPRLSRWLLDRIYDRHSPRQSTVIASLHIPHHPRQ